MPRRFADADTASQLPPASLWRRLAAIFYDFLLCVAMLMVVTGILLLISNQDVPLGETQAIGGPVYKSILFLSLFVFFAKFWTWPGQTLGMQSWRIRVQNRDGSPISLMQAMLRFFAAWLSAACFGLGYLWMLWDKEGLTWHDRFSESRVVVVPKILRE
ncbi:RDD family protein [Balneatrix alpica]|uniref:RDD family protein n=1 Tax=Balneatrix alpica TaxID=75684 RepID=A0ABV5ZC05_9GAMM|nr:RDD family protein [Balneatrix alpica]